MNLLSFINADFFLLDVLIFSFIAWGLGLIIYPLVKQQLITTPQLWEKVHTSWFNKFDLLGITIVVLLFSTMAWLPLITDKEQLAGDNEQQNLTEFSKALFVLIASFMQFGIPSAILLFVLHARVNILHAFGLIDISWKKVFQYVGGGVLVTFAIMIILGSLGYEAKMETIFGETGDQAAVELLNSAKSHYTLIAIVISAVVLAPLGEELIFRGFLYGVSKKYTGPIFSIITSSLIFAVVHGHAPILLPLFIVGAILAIIYELSGSLWTSIILHSLFNLINVIHMVMSA